MLLCVYLTAQTNIVQKPSGVLHLAYKYMLKSNQSGILNNRLASHLFYFVDMSIVRSHGQMHTAHNPFLPHVT